MDKCHIVNPEREPLGHERKGCAADYEPRGNNFKGTAVEIICFFIFEILQYLLTDNMTKV